MRRIYIIPNGADITDEVKTLASGNTCNEIVTGIPPRLADMLQPNDLPIIFQENEDPPRIVKSDIDILKEKLVTLETRCQALSQQIPQIKKKKFLLF